MFGFFKKKDKQSENPPLPNVNSFDDDDDMDDQKEDQQHIKKGKIVPSAKAQELLTKWEDLTKRIQQKAVDILKEAEEKSQSLIDGTLYDTQAIHQFWSAIKKKAVHNLSEKVDEGWDKFGDLTDEADLTTNDLDFQEAGMWRDETNHWLEVEYERYYVRVIAKAAKKIWENALHEDVVKQFKCSSCGAPLDLHQQVFIAINLKCTFCNFVNTYEPPDKMRMAEGFAIDPLCNETAFSAWENMQQLSMQADKETEGGKKTTADTLDKWEAAALQYWTTWYKKREELIPEYAHQTQGGIDSKMEWVWKDLRRKNNQWISKLKQ